jgi:polysaccharide biosynthesis/export protein
MRAVFVAACEGVDGVEHMISRSVHSHAAVSERAFSRLVYGAKSLASALILMLIAAVAMAQQAPSQDQLDALKNLSPDQQNSLLQSVLGKGDGTSNKTDSKLNTPETVQPKNGQAQELLDKKGKTVDGRTLRQLNEDPELRADDSVLIDLTPVELTPKDNGANNANGNNGNGNNGNGSNGTNGINGINGANALEAINGLNGLNGNNGNNNNGNNNNNNNNNRNNASSDYGRIQSDRTPKSDDDLKRSEEFRDRILKNNPYKLNRFGVLEVPGLQAIPLAGLTADEATRRLSADPDLRDYTVKLTLLRLQPLDAEGLKPFGYDLFEGVPSTFAPVKDIQVPIDYIVGPGDTVNALLYGNETASLNLTVGRDGRINFPKLGPILVAGMTFDAARAAIEHRVAQQLIGTQVSVTMGDLRSIRVFVLGEAEKPGSYTVSGLSTMTNALFVSGGVKKIGSLRNIELKRNGRLVSVLDLYDLLLHGDTSGDRQLMPGDVIFIPPIGDIVSVYGAVRRPAIYELKGERNVAQVVDIAGGLLPDADLKLVQVERILPSSLQREMRNIDLTQVASRSTLMVNGDILHVPLIRPTLENSVKLSGYVFRPGAFEYHPGLRLSDVLGTFGELRPNADLHYIMIRREVPPEERIEVISADLPRALAARGSAADPELRPRDEITVFNLSTNRDRILEPILRDLELQATPDKPEQIVSIDGRVKAPGRYPLEPTMHVSDLIRAGGSLEDSAYRGQAELTRYEVVDGNARQTGFFIVDLAAIRRGDRGADLQLKPYDKLIVKPIAQWEEPGSIQLAGEVRFPGTYPIHQGETLYSVLQRAGGLTNIAFADGAVFIREELKKREKEQLELLTNRLQSDLASLSLEAVASSAASNTGGGGGASATEGLAIGQQLIAQLRNTKPVGRLVIDVNRILKGPAGVTGDVLLKDGDKLVIPKKTQEITILGEVQSPTSHVFEPGLTRNDYIAKSGGTTQKADKKRIYVVRANGDVISGERSGWFRRSQSVDMHPGDTIVVPLDTERIRTLPLLQAVTTIIYNLAIGFILVHQYL